MGTSKPLDLALFSFSGCVCLCFPLSVCFCRFLLTFSDPCCRGGTEVSDRAFPLSSLAARPHLRISGPGRGGLTAGGAARLSGLWLWSCCPHSPLFGVLSLQALVCFGPARSRLGLGELVSGPVPGPEPWLRRPLFPADLTKRIELADPLPSPGDRLLIRSVLASPGEAVTLVSPSHYRTGKHRSPLNWRLFLKFLASSWPLCWPPPRPGAVDGACPLPSPVLEHPVPSPVRFVPLPLPARLKCCFREASGIIRQSRSCLFLPHGVSADALITSRHSHSLSRSVPSSPRLGLWHQL